MYDLVHFYLHYGSPKDGSYLYYMKRYHNQHHFTYHETGEYACCWSICPIKILVASLSSFPVLRSVSLVHTLKTRNFPSFHCVLLQLIFQHILSSSFCSITEDLLLVKFILSVFSYFMVREDVTCSPYHEMHFSADINLLSSVSSWSMLYSHIHIKVFT
jgi:hypothetical protein